MDFPEPIFSNLGDYSAVKLFFEGAKRIQSQFSAAENELKAIGQICYWVQGMPLAVLLAAGWMEVLSPVEIVNEINARKLEFLEASWVDAPERQRSMRNVIDHSFNYLTQSEKEIFAGLSVFQGGFSLLSAQAVTGITLPELRALVDKSLVQRSSPGRYTLHELLRQYAEDALEQLPAQYEISHDRHAAYFATALAEWYQDLQGPRQFTALKEIGLELENILNAWNWMAEKIQVQRMSQALFGFLNGILVFLWGIIRYRNSEKPLRKSSF